MLPFYTPWKHQICEKWFKYFLEKNKHLRKGFAHTPSTIYLFKVSNRNISQS